MNICIEIQSKRNIPLSSADIKKKIKKALKLCGRNAEDPYEISIVFIDKNEIRSMNRDYRGIDRATDVISFAFQDGDGACFAPFLLGDMFICPEIVEKHSEQYKSTYKTEMLFVIIHGILHLLGFDHNTVADRKKMRKMENVVMKNLEDTWHGRNEN